MTTLAPKLPWKHPFAGGYPRRGGQPLPTDPDALDYLNRVAAADGAAVEVGIAQAIDAFVRGCKADSAGYAGDPTRSNWDAIQASCIMCGARTLSGALVPLKGTAPTPYNFASGDYSRSGATPGIKGDGTTKYLDTNRANNADGQNDKHLAVYVSDDSTDGGAVRGLIYSGDNGTPGSSGIGYRNSDGIALFQCNNQSAYVPTIPSLEGLAGCSRQSESQFVTRYSSADHPVAAASNTPASENLVVFQRAGTNRSSARLSFYSVGSALDLALLDARVTNLVTAIRFHTLTGLLPNDYDPATIAYITAAYAAGGTL